MSFLNRDYLRTKIRQPKPLLTGLDASLHRLTGSLKRNYKTVGELLIAARNIDNNAPLWQQMPDEVLSGKLLEFKEIFRRQKNGFDELVPQAFAAIREASCRRLGMRPFTVQLAGALALHRGYIAQMATGEGKTLSACLAAVINGWIGLPCHIITVNDYLARRDAEWMKPLYKFCGVFVGCVTAEMTQIERKKAYDNDVVYTTSKEITADFLRDRLWLADLQDTQRRQIRMLLGRRKEIEGGLVLRGINFAIVDEADSILIDEAVTPLIISKHTQNNDFIEACKETHKIAGFLKRGEDYTVNEKYKEIVLGVSVKKKIAELGIYSGTGARLEMIRLALQAREFFHRNQEYVIQDGKVVIVDEFTGRLMHQRNWQSGLHQFVEAKEELQITPPAETLARLSFQRFFRFFERLGGMTGTAVESAKELWDIYQIPVVSIPLNKPCRREEYPLRIFPAQEQKWQAIIEEIINVHRQRRPVLVGTRSVKASENLSLRLNQFSLPHRVLNAVRHEEEARIVFHAGEEGAITIATNMAGRGTDIRLGQGVVAKGGLHVIASECHESPRIDRQLFGRAARQGDPGTCRLFVSLDDELILRYLPAWLRKANYHSQLLASKSVRLSQFKAQGAAFRRRRAVLRMDTWLDDSLSFTQGDVK